MKTSSTCRSAFFQPRVMLGFVLCSVGVLLTVIALSAPSDGKTSTVGSSNPVPLVNQPLIPDATAPGGSDFTLTVNGTGFVSGSVIDWNGSARVTTFVNGSQLTAAIAASDITTDTTASVTVVNPSPGGGVSNVVFLPITFPTSSVSLNRSDIPILTRATGPLDVVTADFSQDGELDLALANGCCLPNPGRTVSVLLGNGDGTFQPQVDYATSASPTAIITADFNGDGKLDLVTANFAMATISILLGNGDGTFQAHMDFATGANPNDVITADFNRDGKLDLAVPNVASNTVSILLGNGDGTFQPHVDYGADTSPGSISTADFDQDGKLDLAVTDTAGISILLGNGDGTFQPKVDYAAGSNPAQLTAGDLNGDGRLDLAVANSASNTVSILLGNGDGTFQSHVDYAVETTPAGVTVSDLNGDDALDLAVTNVASNTVSILLGKGNGTFQSHIDYATATYPQQSSAGDFDGDGRIDLAVVDVFGDALTILLQTPPVDENCLLPPSGLVSWWGGDEDATDIQGDNDGILENGASFGPGFVSRAFAFNGLNEVVQVGDDPSLKMTTAMTMEAWIYPTASKDESVIASREGEYEFGRFADGTIRWAFANDNPGWTWVSSGFVAPERTWTHVSVTYDNGLITTYGNGIQGDQYNGSGLIGDVEPTLNDFRIGNRQAFPNPFPGRIDEAKIYNRALSADEVAAIYAAGSDGNCKPEVFVQDISPYAIPKTGGVFKIGTTVTILDTQGHAIADAGVRVTVKLPDGGSFSDSVTTDSNGIANYSILSSTQGTYVFEIDRVNKIGRMYHRANNIENRDRITIP